MAPISGSDQCCRGIGERQQKHGYAIEDRVVGCEHEQDCRGDHETEFPYRNAPDPLECMREPPQQRQMSVHTEESDGTESDDENHGPCRFEEPWESERRKPHRNMKAFAQDLRLQERTDHAEHCEERSESRQHKQYSDPRLNHLRPSEAGVSALAFTR
jgi:hypothetical protein